MIANYYYITSNNYLRPMGLGAWSVVGQYPVNPPGETVD